MRPSARRGCAIFLGMLIGAWPATEVVAKETVSRAKLEVTGLGWLRDRDQRLSLERLLGDQRGETIGANAIEDAMFLLLSAVESEGFLKPVVEVEIVPRDGTATQRFKFDTTLATMMPRALVAKEVKFHVAEGVRYEVKEVHISGLANLSVEKVRSYFKPNQTLFSFGGAKAYTPARLRRALETVQAELRQRGYAQAEARASEVKVDDRTGEASLVIEITEGPRWQVSSLNFAGQEGTDVGLNFASQFEHRPWTPLWQQDVRERVRRDFYEKGYPEMTVELSAKPGPEVAGVRPVEVAAAIVSGPRVQVGHVRFEGNERTRENILRRRVPVEPGTPLDPLQLERARYRLARLGVFSAVNLRYEPPAGETRDPVFEVVEAPRQEANVLLGYGSYEQARVGVEFRQLNLFGLAHQSRLEVVQSMKSSRGDYTYTVPEIFGETVDGTAKLFGLQRQEQAFLRQEYGLTLALKRPLPWLNTDASAGYTFQSLRNKDNDLSTSSVDGANVTVASVDLGLNSDRRDNPLRPRKGYRWFAQLEAASRKLGGETDYQRLETGGAFHTSWGNSRWIHLGLTHGVVVTQGADNDRLLPVNKRFFPGGDSSIRGYQSGEAAPRGPDGRFLGAKSYLLANIELEQALTANWSAVIFTDGLGTASRLASYPFDERLYSVGFGIRYQTLIGPVRVEYGRNINPRVNDPAGTLHLSVGFPF